MLRIHMSGLDLSRVRMAARPDALWETVLSFHRLRDRRGAAVFGAWRTETRNRLDGDVRLLAALIPLRGYFPDFLTPSQGGGEPYGIDAGIEALRGTEPRRVDAELALLEAERREAGRTPDGSAEMLGRLGAALRGYHRAAIEPYWSHIRAGVEADRAIRGRALLDGGADQLLASLPPMIRWRPPVLEADYPVDRELHLDGRGLLLQPSYFCRVTPVVHRDPQLPPVLVYPVTRPRAPVFAEPGPWLGRLLGHTRSSVLRAIGNGCTTSELALRAGVSLASASQHAGVLREAGLIDTLRHGSSVLHTLTPLGGELLRGGAPLAAQ
ncbi:winged helix-turn-helix domain-containing protein [Streptomyces sp. NPDC052052]|uniref:ArsR/SmtB family transcription factor n=1 Tax=Streptomyces sp. NPDC052052 TaxID=3154756 RepID=UPI00342A6983